MSETKADSSGGERSRPVSQTESNSDCDGDAVAPRNLGLGIAVFRLPVGAAEISLRRTSLAWLLAAVILFAAGAVVAWLRPAAINHTDMKRLLKPLTRYARGSVQPEPLEREIYLILTLLSPAAALAGGWATGLFRIPRIGRQSAIPRRIEPFVPIAPGLGLALTVAAVLFTLEFPTNVFLHRSSTRGWHWLAAGSLVLAAIGSSFPMAWQKGRGRPRFARCMHWAALAGVIALIAAGVATSGVFDVRHMRRLTPLDWNTVFYSASQAVAGARPMIDFTALYGYYSMLLKPWFAWVGLSVFSFTATMAALQGISMAFIGWVLWRRMRSGALLLLCVAAMAWMMITWVGIYLAYYPIRLLFPAISVLAIHGYLGRPTAIRAAAACALLGGPGMWWNLDSGVVAIGSWFCVLVVKGLTEQLRRAPDARQTWRHCAISLGAAVFGFAAIYLVLSADAGRFPDIRLIVRYQTLFYITGYGMLPMPLSPYLWQVVAGIYLAGLIYGLSGAIRARRLAPATGTILHLSVLGVGLFSYYQGCSHDLHLIYACWPAVGIAFLFADRLLAAARLRVLPRVFAAGALPIALLGGACLACSLGYAPSVIALHWKWLQEGRSRNPPSSLEADAAEYIARCELNAPSGSRSSRGQSCAILSPNQGTYFASLGMRSTLKGPSVYEILLKRDLDALETQLRSRSIPRLFIEDTFVRGLGPGLAYLGPGFRSRLLGWYRVVDRNPAGNLLRLEPRPALDNDPDTTFAREFGERARLSRTGSGVWHAVAFGPSGVLLDTEGVCASFPYQWRDCSFDGDFTVEIVFRQSPGQPGGACLVSNRAERGLEGFAILQSSSAANAFVLEAGDGHGMIQSAPFTVEPDAKNYLAVIRRGDLASVFINGRSIAAPSAHFSSATPLTFGNSASGARPFQGEILEVQWAPVSLLPEELERTWRLLAPSLY